MKDQKFNKQLGSIIRGHREVAGLTQEEVAASLGVSVSTYTKYETGDRSAPPQVIVRLAPVLGTTGGGILDELANKEDAAGGLELNCAQLAALRDEEAAHFRVQIDLARLVRTSRQALRLIRHLETGELGPTRALLARSVTAEFSHILRFLVSAQEQLTPARRGRIVMNLVDIYASLRARSIEDRAAREQAAYLAGASGLSEARQEMEKAWGNEEDPWVRRSIVRGLAKSGLTRELAEGHIQELLHLREMQRVDLGYWRFYSRDERDLRAALTEEPPDRDYRRTINALLHNMLARTVREDRSFDFITMAHIAERVTTIAKAQRSLLALVLVEEPRESEAGNAWMKLRDVAESRLNIKVKREANSDWVG